MTQEELQAAREWAAQDKARKALAKTKRQATTLQTLREVALFIALGPIVAIALFGVLSGLLAEANAEYVTHQMNAIMSQIRWTLIGGVALFALHKGWSEL